MTATATYDGARDIPTHLFGRTVTVSSPYGQATGTLLSVTWERFGNSTTIILAVGEHTQSMTALVYEFRIVDENARPSDTGWNLYEEHSDLDLDAYQVTAAFPVTEEEIWPSHAHRTLRLDPISLISVAIGSISGFALGALIVGLVIR